MDTILAVCLVLLGASAVTAGFVVALYTKNVDERFSAVWRELHNKQDQINEPLEATHGE